MTTSPVSTDAAAATQPKAVVIPFPKRTASKAEPVKAPGAMDPQMRLARALISLESALLRQRTAMKTWQDVLGELKTTTTTLNRSMQRYNTSLQSLGKSVNDLHTKARDLEAWADNALETKN